MHLGPQLWSLLFSVSAMSRPMTVWGPVTTTVPREGDVGDRASARGPAEKHDARERKDDERSERLIAPA
jgi:hypothetical protein